MREVDGVTTLMTDTSHKRRSDVIIEDGMLQQQAVARLMADLARAMDRQGS